MTRVLVTCFEPFGQDTENASQRSVEMLAAQWSEERISIVTGVLPVVFATACGVLDELTERHRPDAVVAVGEAGGRWVVTPETTARNWVEARIPDNDSAQPPSGLIEPGPSTLPTRLDVPSLLAACAADGIAAEASHDAGGFLCNLVFHHLLAHTALPGGFVHVPALRSHGSATVGAETDGRAGAVAQVTIEECAAALAHAVRLAAG